MHRLLDQAAPLAKLALESRTCPPALPLKPVARGGSATLVALELPLEPRASAVLGGHAFDGRDQVVAGEQAGADWNEDRPFGDDLGLRGPALGLRRGRSRRRARAPSARRAPRPRAGGGSACARSGGGRLTPGCGSLGGGGLLCARSAG